MRQRLGQQGPYGGQSTMRAMDVIGARSPVSSLWLPVVALAALLSSVGLGHGQTSATPEVAPKTGAESLTAAPATGAAEGVIVSHGISTFGELALPADLKHLPYVNPEAPKGGTISLAAVLDGFDSMNPFSVQGRSAQGSSMMLESILTGSADEIGASYCFMCTTMEYPQDRSWVVFNLREDVTFSDGSAMTAEDVLFSYELLLSKGLSDFRSILATQVESAEVLSPHQIKFSFKPDVATRDLPATMGSLPVFSKADYTAKGQDLEESSLTAFLGTGAYVPEPIKGSSTITYRRNPEYWAQDLPFGIGRNNYDVIRYEYFAESNAAFEAFKGGIYTFREENIAKQWAESYGFPAVTEGRVKLETIDLGTKANGQSFVFNLRRPHLQDPRVRQAIAMMFNFEWTNKTLFYGAYSRINSFWENSWLAAEGVPSAEEQAILQPLVAAGLLAPALLDDTAVMAPVSREDRATDRSQIRQAAALLDAAGWVSGEDGMRRNAKGERLKLSILEDNPSFEKIIAPWVENLRALGIDARMEMVDSAQNEVRTRNPAYDFDVTGHFTMTDYFPGGDLLQWYGSKTADVSVFNLPGLKSPAVDRLIDVVMAAQTRDAMTVAVKALDRVLRAEQFRVPMWYKASAWYAYYDMYEHPAKLPLYATGYVDFWWINPEKEAALKASGAFR